MKTTHISDHDIQQYSFDLSECETEIITHMNSCVICKMRAESYQSLSYIIKDQPDPIFEFNLSEQVLKQLAISPKKKSLFNYFIYFLIILSIGVVVSSLYYFNEVFINLLSNSAAALTYFIISVTILIYFVLSLDMFRSFNRKINMLNY